MTVMNDLAIWRMLELTPLEFIDESCNELAIRNEKHRAQSRVAIGNAQVGFMIGSALSESNV